eukprot:4724275-Amphidinium_carterae.1
MMTEQWGSQGRTSSTRVCTYADGNATGLPLQVSNFYTQLAELSSCMILIRAYHVILALLNWCKSMTYVDSIHNIVRCCTCSLMRSLVPMDPSF